MMRFRPLLCAAALALFAACGDGKLAGGYDDVENPAIQASLLDSAGNPYGAATLRLYARYQNPFKDSLPLLSVPVPAAATITIADTAIVNAFAAAKARGTPSPGRDTLEFNLAASAADGEAFLGGFLLIKGTAGWRFARQTGRGYAYPDSKGILAARPVLGKPLSLPKANVGGRGLDLGLKGIFIPGSAWKSAVTADGSFTLDRLAQGKYGFKGVAVDDKIWSAADSLTAGAEYPGSEWSEAEVIWVDSLK
jgi:hypothetical protein